MALPKIDLPIFELTVPSNGKTIKYRPFTVKEEKILLIAQESKDSTQIINSIKQIINNCVLGDFDVEDSPSFDLEYILLNIRAKSVNDIIDIEVTDQDTDEKVKLSININEIEVIKSKNVSEIIKLNEEYSIKLRYPTLNDFSKLIVGDSSSQVDMLLDVLKISIDTIFSESGEILKLKDFSKAEVDEFINSFPADIVKKIKEFFDSIPQIKVEKKYTLADGTEKTLVIQGLETFFI